jgi:xanthine/uracil/vitamin C permease (AzgA family)
MDIPQTVSSQQPHAAFEYTLPTQLRPFEDWLNEVFKLQRRNVTVKSEFYASLSALVCSSYVLPVVPQQLAKAGYDVNYACVTTAVCLGLGSLLSGIISNNPFIISPLASVSVFYSAYLRSKRMSTTEGSQAMIGAGLIILSFWYRPFAILFARLTPICIRASASLGIAMLITLAGVTQNHLVVQGEYVLSEMGEMTAEIRTSMVGVAIIAILLHYNIKAAFAISMSLCSIFWWIYSNGKSPINEVCERMYQS